MVSNNYSDFELQLFVLELGDPLLIAVIYRPPKVNTNFLTEFAEFLGHVTPKYDKLLVLSDFNVHVCCMNNHLAKEFTHLLNAFDFSIGVNAPTHKGGHILDLVLLHGLSVTDIEVCENGFSDHKTVIFTVSCSAAAPIVSFCGCFLSVLLTLPQNPFHKFFMK